MRPSCGRLQLSRADLVASTVAVAPRAQSLPVVRLSCGVVRVDVVAVFVATRYVSANNKKDRKNGGQSQSIVLSL